MLEGGRWYGRPSTALYGMRFTVHCRWRSRAIRALASAGESLISRRRVYSYVISRFVVEE